MAQTLIRGSTQILDGSITAAKLAGSIPLSALLGGTTLIKADGSVPFTANQSVGGFKFTDLADATNPQDALNLRTAQSLINGLGVSKRARVIATTNVSLTGLQNFDSVTGVAGDIVWLNGQTTASQNGLWQMNAGAWTRPSQWAAASSQKSFLLFVEEGTTYHDTKWTVIADAIVVDTTSVSASQDTSGSTYTNGAGLSLTGNTFAVKLLSTGGLSFDGSNNIQITLDGTNLALSSSGIKIANGTAGQVMLANASGIATFTTLSGDVTINSSGAVTVNASTFIKAINFVCNEVPSGLINGSNATFTLAAAPIAGKETIHLNGVKQFPGAGNDYTISGATITMLNIPLTGDRLTVDYIK